MPNFHRIFPRIDYPFSEALGPNMNRTEIQGKLSTVTSELLREKGFISPVDVFIRLGCLDAKDHEAWRLGRVPCLEMVIKGNLSRINFIMATLRRNSLRGGLRASVTGYRAWGKKGGWALRFSKSETPHLEAAYATHFVKTPGLGKRREPAETIQEAEIRQ